MDKLDLSKKELNNLKKRTNLLVTIDHINSRGISDISFNPLYLPQYKRGFYGPNLQIISEDFIKEKKKVKKNKEIKIFLAQGGSNSNNLLLNLLKKINFFLKELKFCKIFVLVGQASKQKDKIFNLAKKYPKKIIPIYKKKNLAKVMNNMDLAISSGGIISCELAYLNIPTILITKEKKEIETMNYLEKSKGCKNLGFFTKSKINKLNLVLQELIFEKNLRNNMKKNLKLFFEKDPLKKVYNLIFNELKKKSNK